MAVRGENMAQQKLHEAEAEVEAGYWERRNSDIANHENNQEFESQPFQLQQVKWMGGSGSKRKVMPAPTSKRPEERKFEVDSGASLHMVSWKELSSEELDTVRRSRTPTVVLAANGEVHTIGEAQVFVHDLNLFVTVQSLDETLAVLSLWAGQRSKVTVDQRRESNHVQNEQFRTSCRSRVIHRL